MILSTISWMMSWMILPSRSTHIPHEKFRSHDHLTIVDLSIASSSVSTSPFGNRFRMSCKRPSISSVVKPWISDRDRSLSSIAARTAVDSGLLTIALASLAPRFPFTIQYARETIDAQTAARPEFRRANFVLTGAWTAAFVVMLIADLATIYLAWLPFWTGLAAAFAARNIAAGYTQWYTASRRARFAAERAGLLIAPAAAAGETT